MQSSSSLKQSASSNFVNTVLWNCILKIKTSNVEITGEQCSSCELNIAVSPQSQTLHCKVLKVQLSPSDLDGFSLFKGGKSVFTSF